MKRFRYPLSTTLLILLGLLTASISFAQPANDNCSGAVTLVSGTTCTSTSSTLQFATSSSPAATCGGATAATTYDVWFGFVAVNATTTINLSITGSRFSSSTSYTPYIQVLSGASCAGFASISCQAASTSGTTRVSLPGLTVGNFYYIRVYTVTNPAASGASKWNFNICVQHQPVNDDCSNAITLTPGATCANTVGTLDLSTANTSIPQGCFVANNYYDVWYKFVATAASHTINLSNLGANLSSIANLRIQVYTWSGSCATLTSVGCGTGVTSYTQATLTVGTTYYVRVAYTTDPSGIGGVASFNICITNGAAPPANDDCTGAFSLTSGTTYGGTLLNSTASGAATCGTINAGAGEVWYSFIAESAYPTINLDVIGSNKFPGSGGGSIPALQIFSGTCGSLTSLTCNVANTPFSLTTTSVNSGAGLTVGATYYFRVTSNKTTATIGAGWDFTVSITNPSGGATVDYGKSYVNITKGTNGGTIDPGDVLEIRATFVVSSSSYVDSVAYYDTLLNTKGFALVPGSLALRTNEGKIYRYDSPTKVVFTDAFDTDPGWRYAVGLDTAIRINMGKLSSNVARGRISVSDAGPKSNGAIIIMATYRVIVYAPYDTKINYGGGKFTYRNPLTGSLSSVDFVRDSLIVYKSPGLCPNSTSPTNIISDEYGGTFGTAPSSGAGNRNRSTSPNTNYIYANFGNNAPQDYYYGIANNTSGNTITAVTTWPKSDGALNYRVFDVWDITGDHTGASNTAKGNTPCDPSQPISSSNPCGYMLVVNSAYNTDTAFQYNVTGLCPNTNYEISAWLKNVCYKCGQDSLGRGHWITDGSYIPTGPADTSGVKPNIAFDIDGIDYYTTGNIQYQGLGGTQTGSDSLNNWVQKGFTYKTGATQTGFMLTLRNNAPGGGGNDWAIDDIALKTCSPDVTVTPGPNPFVCDNNTVDIGATISSYFNTYVYYSWEKSIDNGVTWSSTGVNNVGSPTWNGSAWTYNVSYPTFLVLGADSGSQYRVVIASTASNLSSPSCSFSGNAKVTLTVDPCDSVLNIGILSFKGKNENNQGVLYWTTSKEEEPVKYEIQKSKGAGSFITIGEITGYKDPSVETNRYTYTDPELLDNTLSWYRIKEIKTQSNKSKYSKVVQLIGDKAGLKIESLVNPFNSHVKFDLISGDDGLVQVEILDQYQHKLKVGNYNLVKGRNRINIDNTDKLPAGFYILRVISDNNVINRKIIKRG